MDRNFYKLTTFLLAAALGACGKGEPSVAQFELNGIWTSGCVTVLSTSSVRSEYRISGGDMEVINQSYNDPGCAFSPTTITTFYTNKILGANKVLSGASNIDSTFTSQKTCIDGNCTIGVPDPKLIYLGVYQIKADGLWIRWGTGKAAPTEDDRAQALSGPLTQLK